ncbi:hypothetical protein Ctha_1677 [Chloroherpeton thalassium ATCC 35110]|uniref:GIY-YIG domain-containing protein n=1 Tax=Chloroherpeton thalassium (strain ATCC 35110 / GB-78) TaxID=517418 RepID=B3QT36_CHLT3|nr:hypothetical protein [Chloroherpeton thalassium]ACF14135.1 hypothetical protein Ctha_1677 [Chloroherpeton thalassium ATCC 35110]
MLKHSSKHAFAEVIINMKAPEQKGVFCLYDNKEDVVFIGEAESSLRTTLKQFRANRRAGILMYSAEVVSDPKTRSQELIRGYKEMYGQLPLYNQSSN